MEFFLHEKAKCFIFWTASLLFFPCFSSYQLGSKDLYFKTNFLLVLYIWEHLKVTSSESQNKHPLGSALSVCLFLKELIISQGMDVETSVVQSLWFFKITTSSRNLKNKRLKQMLVSSIWKIRIKELPILCISKTSRNHRVLWWNQQRTNNFLGGYWFFPKQIENRYCI